MFPPMNPQSERIRHEAETRYLPVRPFNRKRTNPLRAIRQMFERQKNERQKNERRAVENVRSSQPQAAPKLDRRSTQEMSSLAR